LRWNCEEEKLSAKGPSKRDYVNAIIEKSARNAEIVSDSENDMGDDVSDDDAMLRDEDDVDVDQRIEECEDEVIWQV